MLSLEECHCRYVLALLVCIAGGFTLLSTLLFYNSLWCTNGSCIGTFRKAERLIPNRWNCLSVIHSLVCHSNQHCKDIYLTRVQYMYKVGHEWCLK